MIAFLLTLAQEPAPPVVPLTFPVLGKVKWSDTWGAPRGGGTRKHIGQDLPAEKMRPLVACFDGTWQGAGVSGELGNTAYYHMNNDTPGTDDGKGGDEYMFAPGIWNGIPVKAGQFVGYCGDSGNAEETISHLHFELYPAGMGVVNAAPSLTAAKHLDESLHYPERPEFIPYREGEIRWDGEVRLVDPSRNVVVFDLCGTFDHLEKPHGITKFTRKYLKLDALNVVPKVGDFGAAVGKIPKEGEGMAPKAFIVFRNRYDRMKR